MNHIEYFIDENNAKVEQHNQTICTSSTYSDQLPRSTKTDPVYGSLRPYTTPYTTVYIIDTRRIRPYFRRITWHR
ncbi:unnamed protein product, partial [Rotaria magnacalcarata]